MILKRRVALNGVWLDEVDSRIVISGIEPGDGKENISATDTASGFGQRITRNQRSMLDVVIKFKLYEHGKTVAALSERALLLEKVNAWAQNGGYLTVNYKANRRLKVILAQAPGEGSLWDYTKEFAMTFRAYTVPYWEDDNAQSIQMNSTAQASWMINVGGSAETQCDVSIQNISGMQINSMTVNIGGNSMSFSNLGLNNGETLYIGHDDGLLRIRIQSGTTLRSAMAARDGANDFKVLPGQRTCSFTAQRACRVIVSWRARYL